VEASLFVVESELRRGVSDRDFGEADHNRRTNLWRDADLCLRADGAGRRAYERRARRVIGDQLNDAFAADECDELLAGAGRRLLDRRDGRPRRARALRGAVAARTVLLTIFFRSALTFFGAQQSPRGRLDGDGGIGRRMAPLVEGAHAHERRVAAAGA
jgi:hypothetical protein